MIGTTLALEGTCKGKTRFRNNIKLGNEANQGNLEQDFEDLSDLPTQRLPGEDPVNK